jgi:hypothetical protein
MVTFRMPAIVYVPGRILTGVVFIEDPVDTQIDNEYAHMTLALAGGWSPVLSNNILKATCSFGQAFD